MKDAVAGPAAPSHRESPSGAARRAASPHWGAASVAAGALLVFTNGPILLFSKHVLDRTGRWEDHAVWPVLAAAAACGAALAARRVLDATSRTRGRASRVAAAAVGWFTSAAVASTLWSVDPAATAWRSSVYVGMALLAWAIAGLDHDETAAAVSAVAAAAVSASLLLVWLRPDLGLHRDGSWKGVYTNPNSLGPLAAIGVLVAVRYLLAWAGWRRLAAAGGAAAAVVTLVGTGSRTAWISLAVGAAAATVIGAHPLLSQRCRAATARAATAAAAALAAAAMAAAAAVQWDVPTFSQRREIWGLVWDRILERPVLGHGFFTFWDIEELTQHALLRRGSAHNSLVEVGLGLGLLGAVPFAVIVLLAACNAGSALWRRPGPDTWFGAALVAFLIVENLTESFVLWFSYSWVLLMAAALRPAPDSHPPTDSEPAHSLSVVRLRHAAAGKPADGGSESAYVALDGAMMVE